MPSKMCTTLLKQVTGRLHHALALANLVFDRGAGAVRQRCYRDWGYGAK